MIVGVGGKVKTARKSINLDILALEEDSCREVTNVGRNITWRVDRLGTPLVEIATKAFLLDDPEEIKEIAMSIGRILRVTGKVKRGLGTIRQDLNISIADGARIEIKGVQILDMLPEYIKLEVKRQLALIEIREEMRKRKVTNEIFDEESKVCSDIFKNTKCKFLLSAMKNKEHILGMKLPRMAGLLGKKVQADRSFGKEIADRVKIITGLGGILHTDELPDYGISKDEVEFLRKKLACEEQDAAIIIIGKKKDAEQAVEEVLIRVKEALEGVPEETRHAMDDGTTSFRRYLGGAGRMYPDTDSYPIVITKARVERINELLPELPDKKEARYIKDYKLPVDLARNLTISPRWHLFEELVKKGVDPKLVAVTLEQTIKALVREKIPADRLSDEVIKEIFTLLFEGKIAKEAINLLLRFLAENPKENLDSAIDTLELKSLTKEELNGIIDAILDQNEGLLRASGERAKGKIMGSAMKEVRGKIDGKIVKDQLEKRFVKKLKELEIVEN